MKINVVMQNSASAQKTIESIMSGTVKPNSIIVINEQSPISVLTKAYSSLEDKDEMLLYVDSTTVYPPNLLSEYTNMVEKLTADLDTKLKGANKYVFGYFGLVLTTNRDLWLEREFQRLTAPEPSPESDKRNAIGYVTDNATVDILELAGTILVKASYLEHLDFSAHSNPDTVLSNYFAQHKIYRVQVCTLALNRFMMAGCKYVTKLSTFDEVSEEIESLKEQCKLYLYRQ